MKTLKIAGIILALAAGSAGAQLTGGRWQLSPNTGGGGSRGIARDPQPTVIVVTPPVFHQPFFPHQFFPRRALTLITVPAIVLSDGSVFANFGFGFEPVFRSCSGGIVVAPMRVVGANGTVLSPAAPTYTQPVPSQMTSSQQLLRSAQPRTVVVSSVAQTACFSRDAAGRIFIFR
jgi:hypothetical protein